MREKKNVMMKFSNFSVGMFEVALHVVFLYADFILLMHVCSKY